MFRIYFMPRTNNAALEQREGGLDSVGMNVAVGILLRVIDRLVFAAVHVIQRPRIDARFVRHNHFDVAANVRSDNLLHRLGLRIFGANQSEIAIALPDADNDLLGRSWTPTALLAANVGFINLYRAGQRLLISLLHGRSDAMAEIPCRAIRGLEHPLQLERRHPLFGFAEKIGRKEPLVQRQMGIVKNGAREYAKLVAA